MEKIVGFKDFLAQVKKYRHAIAVVAIGLILMMIPKHTVNPKTTQLPQAQTSSVDTLEQLLCQTLSRISGAGEVHVLLTVTEGEKTLYQTDTDQDTGNDSHSEKYTTVTVTDSDRNETGLIVQTNPPRYQGAVIVCSGADDPAVRLSIVDAVSKATGLGANHISVLKMK